MSDPPTSQERSGGKGRTAIVLIRGFLVLIWLSGALVLLAAVQLTAVYRRGIDIAGTVTNRYTESSKSGDMCEVDFGYYAGGHAMTGHDTIDYHWCASLKVGDSVEVRILPSNPTLSPSIIMPGDSAVSKVLPIWGFAIVWFGFLAWGTGHMRRSITRLQASA